MVNSDESAPLKLALSSNISWCESVVKNMKFGYVWTIKNFSALQSVCSEYSVESSSFSCENDENMWFLLLYPCGRKEKRKSYLSLYLYVLPESPEMILSIDLQLSVLNSVREKIIVRNVSRPKYTPESGIWGFDRFVELDFLTNEMNNALPNNELTICCEIVMLAKPNSVSGQYNGVEGRLADDLGSLLDSRVLSDVVLVAEDKEVPAHKLLLAARSPVFAAMFRHDMMENLENRIVISDMCYSVLKEMLRFIYTDKLPVLDELMIVQLLSAADKYDLQDLKVLCDQTLSLHLSSSRNIVKLITLAGLHDCKHLKAQLKRFMKSRTSDDPMKQLFVLMMKPHHEPSLDVFRKPEMFNTCDFQNRCQLSPYSYRNVLQKFKNLFFRKL